MLYMRGLFHLMALLFSYDKTSKDIETLIDQANGLAGCPPID